MLQRFILYSDVIRRLGFLNCAYVAWYRFTLKTQVRKRCFPRRSFIVSEPFFKAGVSHSDCSVTWKADIFKNADRIIHGEIRYFACFWRHLGNPPDWFLNPFNGKIFPNHFRHWTEIEDFDSDAGDIKIFWEASRFEWAVTLARALAVSGRSVYLDTLNGWLKDWADKNPLNIGPNWKCGQEAAIRVFNLMYVALILDQVENVGRPLLDFIYHHLERIDANIRYAVAQDNNHGTSEAAALFIGGYWCAIAYNRLNQLEDMGAREGIGDRDRKKKCLRFCRKGRRWLENRVGRLIDPDGSFSQHSTTYHRVLVDTLVFAEFFRRKLGLDPFSIAFYRRATDAIQWLYKMTDHVSGNSPNLGANDGTMLLNIHSCEYRDFRPSLQTAGMLFHDRTYYGSGLWDEPVRWLGVRATKSCEDNGIMASEIFPGGYVIIHGKDSWGMLRFPVFRFRPAHNDVFHFDLWHMGENVLRDGGSYSYEAWESLYFTGTESHNTIQFDGHDQMPRLGRFLFGKWIKSTSIGDLTETDGVKTWSGSYRDGDGCFHRREVSCKDDVWEINDEVSGYKNSAVMRWRLNSNEWRVQGNCCISGIGVITVDANVPIKRFEMVEGFESCRYFEMSKIPVLEIELPPSSAVLKTKICFREDRKIQ